MAERPPKSYAQLVKEVLERFSGDELPEGSLREHWRIASSSTQPLTLSEHSKATLHRLNNLSSSSSSSSSSSGVAVRTKESLIKLNATGNSSIAGKDRHFLACIFSSSSSPSPEDEPACYVYTSKESTLSDLLEVLYIDWEAQYTN